MRDYILCDFIHLIRKEKKIFRKLVIQIMSSSIENPKT